MMNENYTECRILPAINETFPQFSARPPTLQQHLQPPPPLPSQLPPVPLLPPHYQQQQAQRQIASVNNLILSPLDLSLRAGVNIVPITPPSTPSPPRKRSRFMTDEHYLWRPHVMGTTSHQDEANNTVRSPHNVAKATEHQNYPTAIMTYTRREELSSYSGQQAEEYETSPQHRTFEDNRSNVTTTMENREEGAVEQRMSISNFCEIPKSQRSVTMTLEEYHRQPFPNQRMRTIYVDDETIVLTEDEDDEEEDEEEEDVEGEGEAKLHAAVDENDEDEDREDAAEELEEENETLVSSQELNEDLESNEAQQHLDYHSHARQQAANSLEATHGNYSEKPQSEEDEDDEEEEYVDILSNDDDDINPLSSKAITMLRLQSHMDLEQDLAKTGQVLTRNKLVYENEELHNRAVDGLAKLFDRDFPENTNKEKTYIDLTNCPKASENPAYGERTNEPKEIMITSSHVPTASNTNNNVHTRPPYKPHKTERKRMKLRKHMSLDEETISPVSGTIIRKLRDDEELVVRKGDIDPAFNVVEVTEEAKAILASIDNKIGAYLCQLCRTLYDDAFKLAQHRCPRIVHIEYKCSECEKVFNCPANLASHRRWHKPKSELLANSQAKKRQHPERIPAPPRHSPDKNVADDGMDGIYPCNQCGKTFRRQAYLKKHQASHQMLENLKSLDIFKNSSNNGSGQITTNGASHLNSTLHPTANRMSANPIYPPMLQARPYHTARFGAFPFGAPFDHRRFYTLGEFYLSQQLERSSAFQYVQANHLRNLSNAAAGNFAANRPVVPSPIIPLPVK
uniref:C2H2-type domain-containing protein n=1 Tax=Stomoxys calcitrans TaxID=35570 RepID=A0A1I8PK53_STOCA